MVGTGIRVDANEQAALRWGGLAGMLGSALLLAVFAFLATFVGLDTLDAKAAVERFPDIRWARIIENTAYLLTLALWALHSMVLFIALRRARLAPALAASVMSVLGLAFLATGAVPHTASTAISDLYHAPDTATELRPFLVIAWQVSQAWVDTLVVTGIVLTPIGLLLYGIAMLGSPDYGKSMGVMGLLFGLAGLYAAVAAVIEEGDIVGLGIFALVFFHAITGWTTYRLSQRPGIRTD